MDKIFAPIKRRIIEYIEYKEIKKENFYNETGLSASNFKGKGAESELGGDKIAKILSCYNDLDADWLLTGKGNMLKLLSTERGDNHISGSFNKNVGNSIGGHMINIGESTAEYEKIIKGNEIEITRQGTPSQETQRTTNDFSLKVEAMERLIKLKDELICSLNQTIEAKNEVINLLQKNVNH